VPDRLAFDAVIEWAGRGGGAYVRLPEDAASVFGTGARFPIRATSTASRTRVDDADGRRHVLRRHLEVDPVGGGVEVGDTVVVVVERDTAERVVDVPAELTEALVESPDSAARFEALSFTHRREHARYVAEAKKAETRRQRAARTVGRLLTG
jgi:Bacteriocin-protection, YdeI or OmpD-Associated